MGCESKKKELLHCLLDASPVKLRSVLTKEVMEPSEVTIDGYIIDDDPVLNWTKHPDVSLVFGEFFIRETHTLYLKIFTVFK